MLRVQNIVFFSFFFFFLISYVSGALFPNSFYPNGINSGELNDTFFWREYPNEDIDEPRSNTLSVDYIGEKTQERVNVFIEDYYKFDSRGQIENTYGFSMNKYYIFASLVYSKDFTYVTKDNRQYLESCNEAECKYAWFSGEDYYVEVTGKDYFTLKSFIQTFETIVGGNTLEDYYSYLCKSDSDCKKFRSSNTNSVCNILNSKGGYCIMKTPDCYTGDDFCPEKCSFSEDNDCMEKYKIRELKKMAVVPNDIKNIIFGRYLSYGYSEIMKGVGFELVDLDSLNFGLVYLNKYENSEDVFEKYLRFENGEIYKTNLLRIYGGAGNVEIIGWTSGNYFIELNIPSNSGSSFNSLLNGYLELFPPDPLNFSHGLYCYTDLDCVTKGSNYNSCDKYYQNFIYNSEIYGLCVYNSEIKSSDVENSLEVEDWLNTTIECISGDNLCPKGCTHEEDFDCGSCFSDFECQLGAGVCQEIKCLPDSFGSTKCTTLRDGKDDCVLNVEGQNICVRNREVVESLFCSNGTLSSSKIIGTRCAENYQCLSNLCYYNTCSDGSFRNKFVLFFRHLFFDFI